VSGQATVLAWLRSHLRATSFVLTLAAFLVCNLTSSDKRLFGDAAHYWSLAGTFTTGRHFSFYSYTDRLRGYSMPLMLYGVQQIALAAHLEAVIVFRAASAVIGAVLFAIVFPAFLANLLRVPTSVGNTLIFAGFGLAYWRGHLLYPLTDFPALLLFTSGLLLLPGFPGQHWSSVAAFGSGVALAIAANARPVYEIALLAVAALVLWHAIRSTRATSGPHTVLSVTAFGLGAAIALMPQSLINSRIFETWSPFAHSRATDQQPNLYVQQLGWGVGVQRYETNIGPNFPVAVMFLDTRGLELLGLDRVEDPRSSIERKRIDLQAYLRLIASHPVFFASSYVRHLFNGLDVAYATPYVTRLAPRSIPFALANYVVLALAILGAASLLPRLRPFDQAWHASIVVVFLTPALLAIPTAIEPRFLLPLWMLAYGFVAFRLLNSERLIALVGSWRVALVLAAGALACFELAASTYSQIQNAPTDFELWCLWC
jgi:hypothetical protein